MARSFYSADWKAAGGRPGEPVTLVDDAENGWLPALADPANEICARVYHRRADMPFIPAQASRAWERTLHSDPGHRLLSKWSMVKRDFSAGSAR
jgi:hypothetical protein